MYYFCFGKMQMLCWKEKFLVDDGRYRYIMSGSLLGVELNNLRSVPVGYMEVFDLIPSELNSKSKRFFIKDINTKARAEMYENEFLWLKNAGVAIPVFNVDEPKLPLKLASSRNLFKLFSNDVGLLACQYSDGIQLKILTGDDAINHGSVHENVVAQELLAHGFDELYYYNSKKMGELDFILEYDGNVFPVEVKSGKDYSRHRALNNILTCPEYDIPHAVVLCNNNFEVKGNVIYVPIYMMMFLQKEREIDMQFHLDLNGL